VKLAVRYFDQLLDTPLHEGCDAISIQISLFLKHLVASSTWGRLFSSFEHQKRDAAEKHAKIIEFCKGHPRLNFSLEMFLCAILSEMVLFDADLHSKHENQVASAISLAVSKLLKFSVEAGMKNTPLIALCGVSGVAPLIIIDEQLQ